MKEASGEVSMVVVTLAIIAALGILMGVFWGPIEDWIAGSFGGDIDVGTDKIGAE